MRFLYSLLGVALLLSLSACDSEEATQTPIQPPEQTTSYTDPSESESLPESIGEDATEVEGEEEDWQAMPVPQIETRDLAVEEEGSPEP